MPYAFFKDLDLMDYQQAWDFQEQLFNALTHTKTTGKTAEKPDFAGHFLLVEHPHVFTLGKSGDTGNLLANEQLLQQKGASFYRTNRGGDITYHGPGQIVGYPVLNIDVLNLGVRRYVFLLEEVIIRTLSHFHIDAGRLEGAAGVWLDSEISGKARKICAIGVRASRGITMHGFAFNINTDLSFYQLINPCGFTDKGVTSLEKESGKKHDMKAVKALLLNEFEKVFQIQLKKATD
jgi:lipoyl(octanoyl) transferase